MAGRYEEAKPLQTHIQKIDAIMLPYLAAGIKACLKLMGFEGMELRSPTKPMPPAEIAQLQVAMRDAGLIE